jgi:3-phosphoshikimate 1-carboxyvinyltransferase
MIETVRRAAGLAGRLRLPADKSISHRVALLAAVASGESEIVGFSDAADPQSTLACLSALGVEMSSKEESLHISGRGLYGLRAPAVTLDCGNSGTTMRLLAGFLAGHPFGSTLTGDESLSLRPMERIAEPLRHMGASVELANGRPPVAILGGRLRGCEYVLPVASAQVKGCVLLAGLLAEGETTVVESTPSRDHTERLLALDVFEMDGRRHITIRGGEPVRAGLWVVPKDFSAAAFFLVAGSIVPGATLELPGVGLNPSRAALLDVLGAMGALITVRNERQRSHEPVADLTVETPDGLHGVSVGAALIPNLIDEIPVLAVAAACAEGLTEIRGAAELRYKESDRLAATAKMLRDLGARVEELPDGLIIEGGRPLRGTDIDAAGDHRIAMAGAIAGLAADGETRIHGADCVAVSFPGFWDELRRIALDA